MAAKKKLTFEQQLAEVESIISQMESGAMPLEESMKHYEEGMKALSALEKELATAAQKLTMLRRGADGQETEVPLEVDGE